MVRVEPKKLVIEISCVNDPRLELDTLCSSIINVLRAQSEEGINVYATETLLAFLGEIIPVECNIKA